MIRINCLPEPKSCKECFLNNGTHCLAQLLIGGKDVQYHIEHGTRPHWCPVRGISDEYETGFQDGYESGLKAAHSALEYDFSECSTGEKYEDDSEYDFVDYSEPYTALNGRKCYYDDDRDWDSY